MGGKRGAYKMEEPATSCLSPQEPDLGKGGRIEEVLESRSQPGVPGVTPRPQPPGQIHTTRPQW